MGKGVKGLNLLFATIFGLSTFFTPLNRVSYAEVLRRRSPAIINVDEQRKTFTTNPVCENDKKAFDLLSLYFFEKKEDDFKRKTNELENKIKEFFWKNPTPFPVLVKENISSQKFNVQEFIGYQSPDIKVEAVKKGDLIEFEYKLSSQNYFFQWDKSCSVLFISPKGTKLFRKYLDIVYTLDLSKQDKFGTFKETIDKDVALREVADFGVKMIYKKHKEDLLAILEIAPVVVLYEISKKIEDMEREDMEKAAGLTRGNIKVFRYSPAVYFPTQNEVGRKLSIGYNGRPERIEVFINSSLAENPLTKQHSGTDIRKDYPKFLKHYSILPFEPWRGSLVGLFSETEKEGAGLAKEVENKLLKDRGELENYYNRFSGNLHTLNGLVDFLNENLTSDVSDTSACIDQIDANVNKSRESSKSLRERTAGFEYVREQVKIDRIPRDILSWYKETYTKHEVSENIICFEAIDLNGDDYPEIITKIKDGVKFDIVGDSIIKGWQKVNGRWKQIFHYPHKNYEITNEIKNGYKVILGRYYGTSTVYVTAFEFDGSKYKPRLKEEKILEIPKEILAIYNYYPAPERKRLITQKVDEDGDGQFEYYIFDDNLGLVGSGADGRLCFWKMGKDGRWHDTYINNIEMIEKFKKISQSYDH